MTVFGSPHFDYAIVTSTNDLAREWAKANITEGALFTASHQTSGRGRRGRAWEDIPGQSAMMTFVARPAVDHAAVWKLPFAASWATLLAVRSLGATGAMLKWPNDIVVDGKKLAGILVETATTPIGLAALIGIGINVAQPEFAAASEYILPPTSLRMVVGDPHPSVPQAIAAVASNLGGGLAALDDPAAWTAMMAEWGANMLLGVTQIGIDAAGQPLEGTITAVRPSDGAALIRTPTNEIVPIWPR
ncbi:MAG TPA: biotin--[acetyl-CoA-carboxylase] ligase [Capsulimonadaceae bacterium]|jgi:BirA family biotin operon repressor/biotin-[acetyl-CoA-carboxylase] ligase